MIRATDQHVAKDIFLLLGHSSKHYGTYVVYYTDCESTNSSYFKEWMKKRMKIHKLLLNHYCLIAYMKTASFEILYTGTWIYSQYSIYVLPL
jgi:hypothetical protein